MSIRVGTQPIDVLVNGTITNVGPGTVYYKDDSTLTVADNDGFVLPGASVVLDGSQWIVSDTLAYVNAFSSGITVVGGTGIDTTGWAKGDTPVFDGSALVRGKKYRIVLTDPPYYMNKSGGSVIPTGGSYTTNDDAFQAALDQAYQFAAGELIFPPGTYLFNKAGKTCVGEMTANPTGRVTVSGAGIDATRLKFTTNSQLFIGPSPSADETQVYGNITIRDLSIDAQNVGSTSNNKATIISTAGTKTSLANVTVQRVRAYNLKTDSSASGSTQKRGIGIGASYSTAYYGDTAGPVSFTNLLFEDVRVEGGNNGFIITGTVNDNRNAGRLFENNWKMSNIWIDNVTIRRCFHDTGVPNTGTVYGSTNVQIGESAWAGRVLIEDCEFWNSGDTGIELNSVQDATVQRTKVYDARTSCFYWANLGGVQDAATQSVVYRSCNAYNTGTTGKFPSGFETNGVNGAPMGTVLYEDCKFSSSVYDPTLIPWWIRGQQSRATVRRCKVSMKGSTITGGTANACSMRISLMGAGSRLIVDDFDTYLATTINLNTSTTALTFRNVEINTATDMRHELAHLRLESDVSVTQGRYIQSGVEYAYSGTVLEQWQNVNSPQIPNALSARRGAITDVSQAANTFALAGGATAETDRQFLYIDGTGQFDWGRMGVRSDVALGLTSIPGSTLTGHKTGFVHKWRDDLNYVESYLYHDGTKPYLCIDTVTAGVRATALSGGTTAFTPAGGVLSSGVGVQFASLAATYYLQGWIQGSKFTLSYFLANPGAATGATGDQTATVTLTGAAANLFGDGMLGRHGIVWAAADSAAVLDDFRVNKAGAITSSTVRDMHCPSPRGTVYQNYGVKLGENGTIVRLRDKLRIVRCNFAGLNPTTNSSKELSVADTASHGPLAEVTDSTWATVPVSSTYTYAGSGTSYTNILGYPVDAFIYGGTLTTPFLRVGRANANYAQIAGSSTEKVVRLAVGDGLEATYSVIPTLRLVPVL